MIPKSKLLFLTVVVTALSATMPSLASATPEFTASEYPATVTGSNTKGSEVITATSTLTLTPTYTNCESFGFLSSTVNFEGCSYVLHATEKVSEGVYRHHFDISCPAGKSIKITSGTCKMEIKAQNSVTTVKTTNSFSRYAIAWELNGLAYTVTQDGFLCPFGGTGNKTDAKYSGEIEMSRVGGGSIAISGS
jgi:hypothetical protein